MQRRADTSREARIDLALDVAELFRLEDQQQAATILREVMDAISGWRRATGSHVASRLMFMTPHEAGLKAEVGVRELHNQLSRYVRYAAEGGEVVVTIRGQRVARLSALEIGDPLADLRARGLVQEPAGPKRKTKGRRRLTASAAVSDLVAEQRR